MLSDVVVLRATVADVARVAAAEERVDGPGRAPEPRVLKTSRYVAACLRDLSIHER